ncbi:MAG TPA: carbohydrate-binding protein [Bacillota bacterium]|jgi:hypothetical protein|nr:carbohydrate-binding protein [Bacillota bacterium]
MSYLNDPRVAWEPAPVKAGDTVHINYDGLLKNSGAHDVYLHYGSDGWKNAGTIQMTKRHDGVFSTQIPANAAHEINICFKDCANNWDNNSGWNWKIDVI